MRALDFVPSRKRKDHLPCPIPANESQRLVALRSYEVLDTAPEIAYDEIVELTAQICHCPVVFISFVDDDRRWIKSKYGRATLTAGLSGERGQDEMGLRKLGLL